MKTSREELSSNNGRRTRILDCLIVLWVFSGAIMHLILYVLNRQSSSGQLATLYVLVAVLSSMLLFKYGRRRVPKSSLYILAVLIVIAISFTITGSRYGSNALYRSEYRACLAMLFCTFLIAMLVTWSKKTDIELRLVFLISIGLSLVSFLALINGDSITSGGYVKDSSGLIYQNISYYSAYAMGLTVFHALETRRKASLSRIQTIGYIALILLQGFTSFTSGGRGGVVLALILLGYGVVLMFGFRKVYKLLLPIIIVVLSIRYVFPRVINSFEIRVSGLTRVLSLFSGGASDAGRISLYGKAMEVFSTNPVFGCGIGSVFFYLNAYSHNLFTDVLVETGVVGLLGIILGLIVFLRKLMLVYNTGSLYRFLTIVFICGFSYNLFSGYLWANQLLWFPIVTVLMAPKARTETE